MILEKSRGFFILPFIILALIFIVIIGGMAAAILTVPIFRILFQFYILVIIYSFVRMVIGTRITTYIITGILFYIFGIRLLPVTAGVWSTYIIMAYMLSGMIIFGLQGFWASPRFKKF